MLCPMKFTERPDQSGCQKEKCAWWVPKQVEKATRDSSGSIIEGHCCINKRDN